MRFVIRSEDGLYLMPRSGYWERRDRAMTNNGDDTKWTPDLQKARIFMTGGAAANAFVGPRRETVTIVPVKIALA